MCCPFLYWIFEWHLVKSSLYIPSKNCSIKVNIFQHTAWCFIMLFCFTVLTLSFSSFVERGSYYNHKQDSLNEACNPPASSSCVHYYTWLPLSFFETRVSLGSTGCPGLCRPDWPWPMPGLPELLRLTECPTTLASSVSSQVGVLVLKVPQMTLYSSILVISICVSVLTHNNNF